MFPSGAEVVVLDMVARGKDGQLVRDLRADEIEVFEDGRPCRVQGFRLVLPEAAPSQPAASSSAAAATPPAPAGGADDERPAVGSLVILAFDQLGLEGAVNARRAALDFVGRSFPANTWFAVFKIGEGLFPLQGFTGDPRKLKQAIERATTGVDQPRDPSLTGRADNATQEAFAAAAEATRLEEAGGSNPAEAQIARALARMLQMSDRAAREERGRGALFPLISLAKGLRTVSGRKTLLLFSEGLHVPNSLAEVYARAISDANRANVAIYSLDASGLRALDGRGKVFSPFTESAMALEQAGAGRNDTRRGHARSGDTLLDGLRMNVQANLRDLAEATGGFLIANTNDLRPGLERVGADLRSFYEIAYAPANAKADGRFRSIEVKVSRPGVSVRTRRGYYALPPGAPVVLPYELALAEALAAPSLPQELEHRAAALRFADASPEPEALLLVEVPHRQLTLTRDEAAQAFRGLVSLLVQVKDEKGAMVARLSHEAPIEGRLADLDRVRDRSTLVKRAVRLKPGRYTLETAVQDRESGRIGARRTVFEVPAPASGLSLGDVVIVRADTVPAAPAPRTTRCASARSRARPVSASRWPRARRRCRCT